MSLLRLASGLLAGLMLSACDGRHSGFPADHCSVDCVSGDELLVVEPMQSLLVVGSERQLTATLVAGDGTRRDVTANVVWQSADGALASVSADGLVTGAAPGITTVSATLPALTASASVGVSGLGIDDLLVSPAHRQLLPGLAQQFTATAVLTDGSTVDVTSLTDWSTDDPAVASIDTNGRAEAIAEGSTRIDARLVLGASDRTGSAVLDVRAPIVSITSFHIDPPTATTIPGASVPFRAFVLTSENETLELGAAVVWLSTNPAVATIDASGKARGLASGTTGIEASVSVLGQVFVAAAELTVVAPSIDELRIAPDWDEALVGQQREFRATAVLAGGVAVDVTERVLWRSLATGIAVVDQHGVTSALAPGQAPLRASLSFQGTSHSGEALLLVDAPPPLLQSLSVVPQGASVLIGDSLAYRCIAAFSDGSLHDVTGHCLWSSADPAIAVIDGPSGRLTGIAAGTTEVEARWVYQGIATSGTTSVAIIAPISVTALQVTPAAADSVVFGSRQFHAHALLSDGRKLDVSSNVIWTSADGAVASVDAAGLARAHAAGQTEIRATGSYQGSTLSDAAQFTVTAPAVTVEAFRIVPPLATGTTGSRTQYSAEVLLSNGQRLDVTRNVQWTSLVRSVALGTRQEGEFVGLQPGSTPVRAIISLQGTNLTADAALVVVDPDLVVTGLEIEPPAPVIAAGGQQALRSMLLLGTGESIDASNRSLWASADSGIATVDAGGLANGIAAGTTELSATLSAGLTTVADAVVARVVDPATALVALRVAPSAATALIGTDTKYTATAYYLSGARSDVSASVTWTIADTDVANLVSQDGLVRASAEGTTTVSARYRAGGTERTGSASLEVTAPVITITEIQVTPARQLVASGNAAGFGATAILSDLSHVDVTADVQWRSSDTAVAQPTTPAGRFETFAPGTASVSASLRYQGQTHVGQATLLVRAAQPVYLEVSPARLRLGVGDRSPLQAILHFSDGTTEDVSREVAWRSQDSAVASVGAALRRGLVSGVAAGTTLVEAVYREDLTAAALVQVTAPALLSIDVLPATASVAAGNAQAFIAIGNYDDETALDISDRVLWSSSDESIAVAVADGAEGRVQGVTPGGATISAALDGIVGSASLTVTAAVVVSLDVGPAAARVPIDGERDFVAVAVLSDGSRREVTDEVTWTSSAPTVASVSNRSGSAGRALGLTAGSTEIRATYDGSLQDFAVLQVLAPLIDVLVIEPANETVSVGSSVYFTATAVLSDASQLDVTHLVRWSSGAPDIAAISNGTGKGTATALASGTTTIGATLGSLSAQTGLTVSGACEGKPDSVFIVSDLTLRVGETARMQVTGVFPDGCMQDLTEDPATVWDSGDNDVFTIGNKSGIVTGIGPGTAQANVKHRSSTATADVTVLP